MTSPRSKPPTTAPTGLSRPPRIAAANAYRRIACIIPGPRNSIGATIIPAIAPATAARPQPRPSIQPTRTPTRRDESGLNAAARSARPSFVKRKKTPSSTRSTARTPTIPTYW
jgi:hypothetical protein